MHVEGGLLRAALDEEAVVLDRVAQPKVVGRDHGIARSGELGDVEPGLIGGDTHRRLRQAERHGRHRGLVPGEGLRRSRLLHHERAVLVGDQRQRAGRPLGNRHETVG
ncbi:MAG: hypothetical protein ACK559_40795, partial [bacterium]